MLWDTQTRKVVRAWQAHPSGIRAMALSPDGRTLATCGYDREVVLWHTATWRAMLTFAHRDTIYALAFSRDGNTLATGCNDGIARLWRATLFAGTEVAQDRSVGR